MAGAGLTAFRHDPPPYDGDPSACMRQLDELAWAGGVGFEVEQMRVGIRVSEAGMLDRLEADIPEGARLIDGPDVDFLYSIAKEPAGNGGAGAYVVYSDVVPIARTSGRGEAAAAVEEDLSRLVSEAAGGHLIVRAGAVGWEGRAILVLGPRGSGRTTLVTGLLWAGAEYLGDELAVLDPDGRAVPFPRPLSLRCGAGALPVPLDELGAAVAKEPLPVGAVIATVYRPGATWTPKGLQLAQAVELLAAQAVTGKRNPAALRPRLSRVLRGTRKFSGERGEAGEVIFRILSGLGTVFGGGRPPGGHG